jgi:hypothetical protein
MSMSRVFDCDEESQRAVIAANASITAPPPSPRASGVHDVPTVLVVGCPEGLTLRVHDAAVAVGAVARLCGVVTLGRAAERYRPIVIAMTEELYAFDPERFSEIARAVSAEICTMTDVFDERDLAELLAARLGERQPPRSSRPC